MAGNNKMSPRKAMAMGKAAKKAGVKKRGMGGGVAKKTGVKKMNRGGVAKKAGVKKPVMRRGGSGKKKT